MAEEYKIVSTSNVTATVEDRVLSESPNGQTRLVMRAELIENSVDPAASVKVTLVHQKKKKADEWDDISTKPLSQLKAGESMKFALDCAQTRRLIVELYHLYKLFKVTGVPWGEHSLIVGHENELIKAPQKRTAVIKALLQGDHSEEVWRELEEQNPTLATKLCLARIQHGRACALEEFAALLQQNEHEQVWQDFFDRNKWIFGYGLNYRILREVESQPHYGGTTLAGVGAERGDFLAATDADHVRFTVLVEIKRPTTELLERKPHRNHAYSPSSELAGGVAQVQANCHRWEVEGAKTEHNQDKLSSAKIFTIQPKGILVIGNTSELDTSMDHRNSFELYRRNLTNPEVLTFDELFRRAKFIVEHDPTEAASDASETAAPEALANLVNPW